MLAIVDARRDRRPLSVRAKVIGGLVIALTLGLSTAAQLRAQEKKAAAESAGDPAPVQIEVAAKFIELTAEAKAKLLTPLFGPTFPESVLPKGAAGVVALSGVLTEPQFDTVIRGLDQQRGVDLLSTPRVTTKPGQRALIEVVRGDFRYPIEFEKDGQGWKPKKFETRKTGVTFEMQAVIGPDGYTLDLDLTPSVVEFLGWNDQETGKKIPASTKPDESFAERLDSAAGLPSGHRGQPVFSERKVTTSVTIFSGQTVVLGAVGDAVENKDFPTGQPRRQLVIFVTAKILDGMSKPMAVDLAPRPAPPAQSAPDPTAAVVLPRIELRDVPLSEAVSTLLAEAHANGASAVDIIVPKPVTPEPMISLSLTSVPLTEAVQYVASLSGRTVRRGGSVFFLETQPMPAAPLAPSPAPEPAPPAAGRVPDKTLSLLDVSVKDEVDRSAAKHLTLRVPIKARGGKPVDVQGLIVQVLFYDLVDNKDIVQTKANISFRWATPPADWRDSDTETLEVDYHLPLPDGKDPTLVNRKYFGYLVRVYYQGELQAVTGLPKQLMQQFPASPKLP